MINSKDLVLDSQRQYKTKKFSLHDSGRSGYSNWEYNFQDFKTIFHAISECFSLRQSLTNIDIGRSPCSERAVKKIVREYELYGIEFYGMVSSKFFYKFTLIEEEEKNRYNCNIQ